MDYRLPVYDLIISHDPKGEYTRHLRHEEVGEAVIRLWSSEKISARELWTFAYEDGGKKYLPKPIENAPVYQKLSQPVWEKKYSLITETYGFDKDSFEATNNPSCRIILAIHQSQRCTAMDYQFP